MTPRRAAQGRERAIAIGRLTASWGDPIIVRGRAWPFGDCQIFIAGDMAGAAAVSHAEWPIAELVVIEAFVRDQGFGSALLDAVVAASAGPKALRVCTTNDNLDALAFYQRRGFRLTALRPGAVDAARERKASIPLIRENGLPVRDELDLELALYSDATKTAAR
jgi:GNAT superfamily N-acetyltransferase